MAKDKILSINSHIFLKILIFILILVSVFFIGLYTLNTATHNEIDLSRLELQYQNKVDSLANDIDLQIDRFYHRFVYSIFDEKISLEDPKSGLASWLANHPEVWAVTLWPKDQNWPVRILKENFWENSKIQKLDEASRRIFFAFIFNNEKRIPESIEFESIQDDILKDIPIQSISIMVKHPNYEGIQIFSEAVQYNQLLSITLNKNEAAQLLKNDQVVWQLDNRQVTKVTDNKIVWEEKEFITSKSLNHFNLKFIFKKNIENQSVEQTWLQKNYLLFIGLVLVFSILLSIVISKWIAKPVHKFTEDVLIISQGDLHGVVPPQSCDELNQLSNIINYIAHDLARMQELNVGQIISDKIQTEAILRNIADGVIVTDRHQRILLVNKVAETWFGFKEKEIRSQSISQFIQINTLLNLIEDLQKGKSKLTAEFTFIPFDSNQEKIFQAHASRVTNSDNELIGIVTAIRDVTREREIDRIKTELVSMVAHELKSPLTSIFGFSELLLESHLKDPQLREYAHIIMTESSRLTDLVNKFLDLTRLESGRTEIKMNPFDLHSVIDKMLESHARQTESKSIKVIKEIPDALPLVIGDQDMIEQVLLNLYSNAVKYSPKRSKVGIEAKEENGFIIVSIIDNGYGIPKESLVHIFDKFYRVPDTKMNGEVEGSGLGLTLAKEIIQHHGGEIRVQSRLGVGSVFNFTLQKANV